MYQMLVLCSIASGHSDKEHGLVIFFDNFNTKKSFETIPVVIDVVL